MVQQATRLDPMAAERGRMVDRQIAGRGIRPLIGAHGWETELASHYFEASLPKQFNAHVWFEATRAAEPLPSETRAGAPETYPFGV